MSIHDVRWIQRLNHFARALEQLSRFVEKSQLNELERQGLIKAFEYTYELAWNTLKDYFEAQGESDIHGSRDAIRLAFRRGVIQDGETWMAMIISRTLTSHTYNEQMAERIATEILERYYPEYVKLKERLEALKERVS